MTSEVSSQKPVRLGVIGVGYQGTKHVAYLAAGEVPGAVLTAVSDIDPRRIQAAKATMGDRVRYFDSAGALIASGECDGVLIATQHYDHPGIAAEAFAAGLHVLSEKPLGVHTRQVRQMLDAAARSGRVFAVNYNQRTLAVHQRLRELVRSGRLGSIRRTHYTVTHWVRTHAYFAQDAWRGTWAGEGGGVLINQCPHNLDLIQWVCGMPSRVRAFCGFGRHHRIEVEDEVTAFLEYPSGATGTFHTSTAEIPGVNRLEIVGERGRVVLDDEKLTFVETDKSIHEVLNQNVMRVTDLKTTVHDLTVTGGAHHVGITTNFVNAIRHGEPLLSPGADGLWGLMLGNAMLLSQWTGDWVDIPIDDDLFYQLLKQRIDGQAPPTDKPARHR